MNSDVQKLHLAVLNFFSVVTAPFWLTIIFWVALVKADELPWCTKSFVLELYNDWIN